MNTIITIIIINNLHSAFSESSKALLTLNTNKDLTLIWAIIGHSLLKDLVAPKGAVCLKSVA